MKTIGLIGGTSWVSTMEYYKLINQFTNEARGGMNSAQILLHSINFSDFKKLADANNWKQLTAIFSLAAKNLQMSGADCILLCANATHMIADEVQKTIKIPLIHIAEETAKEINNRKLTKIGLLGAKFTMENNFFINKLLHHNIETIIPGENDRTFIHSSIFSELGKGIFTDETKKKYLEIIDSLGTKGAEGIVFACTEIPMLIRPSDCNIPTFDTTLIHVRSAVHFALS